MKKKIQDAWWRDFVDSRLDCVGLDSSIIQSSKGSAIYTTHHAHVASMNNVQNCLLCGITKQCGKQAGTSTILSTRCRPASHARLLRGALQRAAGVCSSLHDWSLVAHLPRWQGGQAARRCIGGYWRHQRRYAGRVGSELVPTCGDAFLWQPRRLRRWNWTK